MNKRTMKNKILAGGEPTKRIRKKIMPQLSLGTSSETGFKSNANKPVDDETLTNFVYHEIKEGPQLVTLSVPPERHTILVNVQPSKIMISDWGGIEHKNLGESYEEWKQYSDFIAKLDERGPPVDYYPIDKEIKREAEGHREQCNGGGCSNYIFKWVQKHYPEYS